MDKKIAIVSDSCPPHSGGGIASAHYNLYRVLKKRGYEVRIFTFYDRPAGEPESDIFRHGTPKLLIRLLQQISHLFFSLTESGKNAYQTVDIFASAIGAMRMNASIQRYKPDIILLSDQGAPGLFVTKPRNAKICLVSHHNPMRFLGEPLMGAFSERDARLAIMFENRVLTKVDRVICPSDYMQTLFHRTYRYEGPVAVIPNIVDTELINQITPKDMRSQMGLPEDAELICMPSVGITIKGADFVFEIIRWLGKHAEQQIGFYIPGKIEPQLARQLEFIPEKVKLYAPGQLPYQQHIAIMKTCSFGISPTMRENYSMALVEALVCGVPMIVFDSGGNSDIVVDGVNGCLLPTYQVEEMIAAAQKFGANKEYLRKIRAQTISDSRERFNPERIGDQYMEFIFPS